MGFNSGFKGLKNIVHQLVLFTRLYKDARSTRHKIQLLFRHVPGGTEENHNNFWK